jgi:hypothetical protein
LDYLGRRLFPVIVKPATSIHINFSRKKLVERSKSIVAPPAYFAVMADGEAGKGLGCTASWRSALYRPFHPCYLESEIGP